MRSRIVGAAFAAGLCVALSGCQSSQRTTDIPWDGPGVSSSLASAPIGEPVQVKDVEGVKNFYIDGPLCVASQPSAAALRGFADDGVSVVISLRSDTEMEKLGFDEAELCAELGMDFAHIPLGGKDRVYTPEALAEFAALMESHEGKAVVHCASGGRVTLMYVAYLIEHRGYELNEAYDVALGLRYRPNPVGMLLGREIEYRFVD